MSKVIFDIRDCAPSPAARLNPRSGCENKAQGEETLGASQPQQQARNAGDRPSTVYRLFHRLGLVFSPPPRAARPGLYSDARVAGCREHQDSFAKPPIDLLRGLRFLPGILITLLLLTATASAQQAAQLFEKSCYSCHNIGSGDKKGPDLKGVLTRQSKDWLREFISTPNSVYRRGDPYAQQLFKKWSPEVMPDQALTSDQIDQILALIDDLSKKNEAFVPAGAKLARAITPTDIDAGRDLFTGRQRLSTGGTSCNSCHSVLGTGRLGGGTLGPDLTAVNTKYKDPELIAILQNPAFPVMKSVFQTRPLNDEEIVQLFAYLQNAKLAFPAAQATPGAITIEPWFIVVGFVSVMVALIAMSLLWRKRLRGVREELVKRAGSGGSLKH